MRNARIAKKKLDTIAKKIGYRKVHYIALCRMLNKEFKSLKVRFEFRTWMDQFYTDDIRQKDYLVFGGHYDTHNEYKYQVNIDRDPNLIYIKPRRGFFTEAYLTVVHELRHGYQHRARKFRKRRKEDDSFVYDKDIFFQDNIRYLMDYDEIDAYAMEHAEAIKMNHDKKNDRYDVLKKHAPRAWKKFHKKVYLFTHK